MRNTDGMNSMVIFYSLLDRKKSAGIHKRSMEILRGRDQWRRSYNLPLPRSSRTGQMLLLGFSIRMLKEGRSSAVSEQDPPPFLDSVLN